MKNKNVFIVIIVIILIGGIYLTYNIYQNKDNVNNSKKSIKQNNLAIMIKEEGMENYSSSNSIPIGDYVLNEEKTFCENGGKVKSYNSETGQIGFSFLGSDRCSLYFDYYKKTLYQTIAKRYNQDKTYLGLYDGEGANTYANPVYYFKGDVKDNNVLFAGYCWKIVRTTDTGGVKLIYNGKQKDFIKTTPVEQSLYTNITNDETHPFTFDTASKTWKSASDIYRNSSGTISFSVATAGDYYITYEMSSSANSTYSHFYKNGTELEAHSGKERGTIALTGLKTSDVIKVDYVQTNGTWRGNNNVTFSISKAVSGTVKSCDNVMENSQVGESTYNDKLYSPADVGYMYNTAYVINSKKITNTISNVKFGKSFTYSNGKYRLTDTITVANWKNDAYSTDLSNYHYTFFNESTSQAKIYFSIQRLASGVYYIELTNGKTGTDALNEMLYNNDVNTKESIIKTYLENWYKTNMTSYTNKLEDTIYCNDRSTNKINGWNPNGGDIDGAPILEFKNYEGNNNSLYCTNTNDKFTVSSSLGNGKLTYPVGLLTSPEAKLANASIDNYLSTGLEYWLFSPSENTKSSSIVTINMEKIYDKSVDSSLGVRPVISLKPNTEFTEGDGSFTSPYVIK